MILILITSSFSLFSDIIDKNNRLSEDFRPSLQERIEKISNDHDIGFYIYTENLPKEVLKDVNKLINRVVKERNPNKLHPNNFLFYGSSPKDLRLVNFKLTFNDKPRNPEKDEIFISLWNKFETHIENSVFNNDYALILDEQVSFIERTLYPELHQELINFNSQKKINESTVVDFSYGLEGWPFMFVLLIALLVWFYSKRYLFVFLAGIIEDIGAAIYFGTFQEFLNFFVGNLVIIMAIFIIESIVYNFKRKRKATQE